jgi:hypothetical protein
VFDEDYLQLSDQEAEHGADGDHEHRPMLAVARWLVPHTAEVYAQHLAAGTPAAPRTVTPVEARETLACS